jgi:hypothetical protein
MEIVSVGPDWAQKIVCGSCRSTMKIGQPDLGWFKKTNWDKGYLGFRSDTVAPSSSSTVPSPMARIANGYSLNATTRRFT